MTHFFRDCIQSKRCLLIILIALLYSAQNHLEAQSCNPDITPPTCTAPPDVTVDCGDFDPTLAVYGVGSGTDNCCMDTVITTVNNNQFSALCMSGTIVRFFKAYDCSGNSSQCSQQIVVNHSQDYFVRFPNDLILNQLSSNGNYGDPTFSQVDCELMGVSHEDEVFVNTPDANIRLERTWTVINWCTYNPNLPSITVPNPSPNAVINHPSNLPGPTVSTVQTLGDPWKSTIVKITPTDTAATNFSIFYNSNANAYKYKQIVKIVDTFFVAVQGKVFSDNSINCNYETGEPLLSQWMVRGTGLNTGQVKEVQSDANGAYAFLFSGLDTVINITLISAGNFGQNCQTNYTVHATLSQTVDQDIPVHLVESCSLLSVGIGTPRLRRCFHDRYTVQGCNLSDQIVQNAFTEVDLDGYLDFMDSSIPGTLVSGNKYKFELGDLQPGDCRTFWVDVHVNCDAPLGYTHCTEAAIYPFDDCRSNSSWSGADVDVSAICDGDSVRMAITNIGDGSMSEILNFVVVEDIIMRQGGQFQLGVGETKNLAYEANGSTWRLEAEEEPLHPWGGLQAVALEGCGGLNSTGLVNLFPLNNINPFIGTDCQQNIGAYDPNDKQAFPVGFGPEHTLRANSDIEYMIRFQNTGTDTAFNIVVLDTLSAYLDLASVRVSASSHPMEFSILEGGVLQFMFANIELPDSNVNVATSNGFLKFHVAQKQDNPDGTRIENRAAIYFDFNEAVMTNTTFHTIGYPVLTVGIDDPFQSGQGVKVYPNPAADMALFQFEKVVTNGQFELKNQLGQSVRSERFSGEQFRFERGGLQNGVYFFTIRSENGQQFTGKVLIQ